MVEVVEVAVLLLPAAAAAAVAAAAAASASFFSVWHCPQLCCYWLPPAHASGGCR